MKDRHGVETLQSISICMAVLAILSLVTNTSLTVESMYRRNSYVLVAALVIISLGLSFHLVQVQDACDALVMKSPSNRLSEERSDAKLSYLIREGPVKAHRVRNKQVVQAFRRLELLRSVIIRRAKDSMRRPRVDGIGAIFFQLLDTLLERPASIDNIVDLTIKKETKNGLVVAE